MVQAVDRLSQVMRNDLRGSAWIGIAQDQDRYVYTAVSQLDALIQHRHSQPGGPVFQKDGDNPLDTMAVTVSFDHRTDFGAASDMAADQRNITGDGVKIHFCPAAIREIFR